MVAIMIDRHAITPGAPDGVDQTLYALTDRNYSVLAIADDAGKVHERARYSPYGEHVSRPYLDYSRNSVVGIQDQNAVFAASGSSPGVPNGSLVTYKAELDFDRNRAINFQDYNTMSPSFGQAVGPGALSRMGNIIGYAGYVYEPATGMYLARNRWYKPNLGRWITRDPAGYVDGQNLYQYVGSHAVQSLDPMGLKRYVAVMHGQNFFGLDGGAARSNMEPIVTDLNKDADTEAKMFGPDSDFWGGAARWMKRMWREECKQCGDTPIFAVVGHSNGGDAARKIANSWVNKTITINDKKVDREMHYLGTIDPIGKPWHSWDSTQQVDAKVKQVANWYQRDATAGALGFRLQGYRLSAGTNTQLSFPAAFDGPHSWITWRTYIDSSRTSHRGARDDVVADVLALPI